MATYTSDTVATRPGQAFMNEDPGAYIVQSFRGPRADSRATRADRPATSLLGSPAYGNTATEMKRMNVYERAAMSRGGGLARPGLESTAQPLYPNDTVRVVGPVGSHDYSGAVVVGIERHREAATRIKDSIPGAQGFILPDAKDLTASSLEGRSDYFQALFTESELFADLLRSAEGKPLVTVGNHHDNPITTLVSPQTRYIPPNGETHIWKEWDNSDDKLLPLNPQSARATHHDQVAADIRLVENWPEWSARNTTDDAIFPDKISSVTVILGSGFVSGPDGEEFSLDLQVENVNRAADQFVNRKQLATGEVTTAGIGIVPAVLLTGGVLAIAAKMGAFDD